MDPIDQQEIEGDSDLLEDLEEDVDSIEEEDGIWEDLDACSLGNAILFEIEHGAEPENALDSALKKLEEDPSYFLQPDSSDYEQLQQRQLSSDMVPEDADPEEMSNDGNFLSQNSQVAASLSVPWTREQVARVANLLDKEVSAIEKSAFAGPPGYQNYYFDVADSDFFDRDPDLYPEQQKDNPDYTSLRPPIDREKEDWMKLLESGSS